MVAGCVLSWDVAAPAGCPETLKVMEILYRIFFLGGNALLPIKTPLCDNKDFFMDSKYRKKDLKTQ